MMDSNQSDPILVQSKLWENNSNNVWLASAVSLSRNFEKFKFPPKLDAERRKQILSLIGKELLAVKTLVNPRMILAEEFTPLRKEFLVEHFLSNRSFQHAHGGEAFILEDSGDFLCALNIQDHLYLQTIDINGELESAWQRLVDIETAVGKTVSYAYSPKYGFLTADPNECGTALAMSVFLQVPALVHLEKIDETLETLIEDSLLVTGIQGNPTEIIGDIIVVRNNYTLGVTEENIISLLRSITTKITLEENRARSDIRHHVSAEIKDRVSRAFGILFHSYQIEAVEALNALSLIKLGADLGWVEGISLQEINNLIFNCRRAHLVTQYKEKLTQEEIPHKRAEFIHKSLKPVHLTI